MRAFDIFIVFLGWILGVLSKFIFDWDNLNKRKNHQKNRLISELYQIVRILNQQTFVLISTRGLDEIKSGEYYNSLPAEQRTIAESIYAKIIDKNNLVNRNNSTPGLSIVSGDGTISSPISDEIGKLRIETETEINQLLSFLE